MIISLGIGALIGVSTLIGGFVLTRREPELEDFTRIVSLLMTTLAIDGYSVTGLCCAVLYEKRKFIPLALSGMIISLVGFLYTVVTIWRGGRFIFFDIDFTLKVSIILAAVAASIAQSCLLLLIKPVNSLVKWILSATLIIISIVALMFIIVVFWKDNFYLLFLGIFAILDVFGTVVTPILNKIYSMQQ
jgi:hypothetical protein